MRNTFNAQFFATLGVREQRMRFATVLASAWLSSLAVTTTAAESTELERLAWLAGCWAVEGSEAGSVEHWLSPAGGTMLGMVRTVKDGQTVGFEFLQIRTNSHGKVIYIAKPSGQAEATFEASSVEEDSVVFENLEHDFPQRIRYRLASEGRLTARVEGMRSGVLRGFDVSMRRTQCVPAPMDRHTK